MAKSTVIDQCTILTVDLQTVFYNRGLTPVTPPGLVTTLQSATAQYLPGNLVDCSKPSQAIRLGNNINTTHDNQVFINVGGYRYRQTRTLAVAGTYTIAPRADCESTFICPAAGNTTVNLNLTHADILPGMTFCFARPSAAGNLVINLTNGVVMSPTDGSTGATITITQYGHVVLRILGSAVPGGPKAFLEDATNFTIS
jgi:hypothetical protein